MAVQEADKSKKTRKRRGLRIVLWTILGLWVLVMVALQVALNSKVLTRIANRIAGEYVEGDVSFSNIKASVFKSFPNLNVSIDDFILTYPHDRFASYDPLIPAADSLHFKGWGVSMTDTLASFKR